MDWGLEFYSAPPGGGGRGGEEVGIPDLMTGMIKWDQKSNPKKSLHKKLTPQISEPQNFQKALNDITRNIKTLEIECL